MAYFDVVESAGSGYQFVFTERKYLLRLAAVPLLVKLCCFVTVIALGWEQDYIKQAIILLPAYLVEGWMVSHLVRLIFFGQRWPFQPSGDQEKDQVILEEKSRAIMGGMVLYALTKFIVLGSLSLSLGEDPAVAKEMLEGESSVAMMLVSTLLILFSIWSFRFLWLYIPIAAGYPVRPFFRQIKGMMTSIYMMGTWMLCYFPILLFFVFFMSLLMGNSPQVPSESSIMLSFIANIFRAAADTLGALIATAGMSYGIMQIFEGSSKKA